MNLCDYKKILEDFGGEDGEMRFGRIESCRIIIIGLGIGGKVGREVIEKERPSNYIPLKSNF